LYGFSPPQISELSVLEPPELEATEFLQAKQDMLDKLKLNLQQATARMKKYADSK
jgi:prefoldin subunit 5